MKVLQLDCGWFIECVALTSDDIVGRVDVNVYEHDGKRLWLHALFVRDDYRGAGVAPMLVAKCKEIAIRLGCLSLDLDVAEDKLDAYQRWYERQGFKFLGMYENNGPHGLFSWRVSDERGYSSASDRKDPA